MRPRGRASDDGSSTLTTVDCATVDCATVDCIAVDCQKELPAARGVPHSLERFKETPRRATVASSGVEQRLVVNPRDVVATVLGEECGEADGL